MKFRRKILGAEIASSRLETIQSTWNIFGSFNRTIQLYHHPLVVYSHHNSFSVGESYQRTYQNKTKSLKWWSWTYLHNHNPLAVTFRDRPNPARARYLPGSPHTMMIITGNQRMTIAAMLAALGVLPLIDHCHPFRTLPSNSGPAMLRYHLRFWFITKARAPSSFGTTCKELSTLLPSKWLL